MDNHRRRARMLMEDKIGTLSPGKKADIVMLRADDLNMTPVYDPVASIVEIAGAGNVDTVIIDGVIRKKDGKLTFPADVLRKRTDELAGLRRTHHARGRIYRWAAGVGRASFQDRSAVARKADAKAACTSGFRPRLLHRPRKLQPKACFP